jgi:DNA gyrase/topoisomerase IV subunit A
MVETSDSIVPILRNIQEGISEIRKEQQLAKERLIDVTDAVFDVQDVVSEMRKDNLVHLGLTTKHRLDFENLQTEMADLRRRLAVLESRS